MNVIIENIFDSASSTQVCFRVEEGPECCLNPGQKTGEPDVCPTPEIGKDECVTIWAVDDGIKSSSNHFQMGTSSDSYALKLERTIDKEWILKNTEGQTDVHVKMGPDGQ